MRYRVTQNYADGWKPNHGMVGVRPEREFGPWEAGQVIDLDPERAETVNANAPGTLEPLHDADGEA